MLGPGGLGDHSLYAVCPPLVRVLVGAVVGRVCVAVVVVVASPGVVEVVVEVVVVVSGAVVISGGTVVASSSVAAVAAAPSGVAVGSVILSRRNFRIFWLYSKFL